MRSNYVIIQKKIKLHLLFDFTLTKTTSTFSKQTGFKKEIIIMRFKYVVYLQFFKTGLSFPHLRIIFMVNLKKCHI